MSPRSEVRWVVLTEAVLGEIIARDRKQAERSARQQYGAAAVRVQSRASFEIAREQRPGRTVPR